MKEKILIIEDDPLIRNELKTLLQSNGYEAAAPEDFSDVIDRIKAEQPHLILLDIKLPGTSGFSLCTEVRTFSEVPIIFVTSCNTDMDELNSIMLGGDAFITKPYNTAILLAKIASLLKKAYPTQQREQIVYGDAVLHLESSSLDYNGHSVELTKNELKILYYLFKNGGKICSRGDMIEYLWDNQLYVDDNALSVNINRIREKLAGIGLTDFIKTKHMKKLLDMAEQLSERYLISEVMELPEQAEDQVYYQLLKMAGKSMLEQIGEVERERLEYKEYIEQWIHEIKTPITAMKLLCENHRMDWTKELLLELEKTNRFTEQALYYARSEHTEKDYSVREMALSQVVHQAIADNKYLLLQSGMRLEVEEMQDTVYSDEKWVRFILNQLIANAVKYRTEQPVLRISTHKRQDQVVLVVEDNGIGIAASDLPRIFEKGFTGQNGRMVQQSTGIGLYLCKRLCEKLGIGITAESSEHGTAISLSFHINCLIHEVQS